LPSNMEFREYVTKALRTESQPESVTSEQIRLLHAAVGLSTEVGELADSIKKHVFYGKPLDKANLFEELGDVAWYMAIIVDFLKVSMESVLAANVDKLKQRYPHKFTADECDQRDLFAEAAQMEKHYKPSAGPTHVCRFADGVVREVTVAERVGTSGEHALVRFPGEQSAVVPRAWLVPMREKKQ